MPQIEGAVVAQEGRKANARGTAAVLAGMFSTPRDTVLMPQCYPILQPGKLRQKVADLLKSERKGRDVQAETARATTAHPRARLLHPLA